jgi:tRNA/rRNA methyltransferase
VSFSHRVAIEIAHPGENETVLRDRASRREWLAQRDYRVVDLSSQQIENDLEAVLLEIQDKIEKPSVNEV